MLENCLQDLRYGFRMLLKSPGFTAVATLSLALGIGANTAIFTLIDAVLLQQLPVQNPRELVQLQWASREWPSVVKSSWGSSWRDAGRHSSTSFSYPVFEQIRTRSQSFASVVAFKDLGRVTVTVAGEARLAEAQLVSGDYFTSLGVRPILGRVFVSSDDHAGAPPAAVVSHTCWQRRFGGDPSAVGKSVLVNGVPFTVAGVTPPEFFGLSPGSAVEITLPLAFLPQLAPRSDASIFTDRHYWWVLVLGRLKPGLTSAEALREAGAVFRQSVLAGAANEKSVPWLELLPGGRGLDSLRRRFSQPLLILMAVVGAVLLIACFNVANLLLARAAARQKEIAVRLSLGTTRFRLIRQLLTESLLLASLGGALGFLLAYWGSHLLVALMSSGRDLIVLELDPNLTVLGFTALACCLTAVLFGLAPALRATRVDVMPVLREAMGSGASRLRLGLARTLVVAQVALSLVLLVGAGLFVRTLDNLKSLDVGFEREGLLLFGIDATQAGYKGARLADLYDGIHARLRALPGVVSASQSYYLLLSGAAWSSRIKVGSGPQLEGDRASVRVLPISPGFLETMKIPLLLGRDLDERDRENAPLVALVNETMARRFFPGVSPIGARFGFRRSETGTDIEVVGVVKDARYDSLRRDLPPTVYLPMRQTIDNLGAMRFQVRSAGDPKSLIPAVRGAVESLDKMLPLYDVRTQLEQIDALLLQERLFARLTGFFSLLALLLVCVGLYGILSYAVARRTGEIGIRMALGAQRGDIATMVLRETLRLVALGIVLGVPASFAVARSASSVIAGLLFGLSPTDVATVVGATLVMLAVAGFAGFLPARRASRVDPMVALRYE